jgi:hypothetical protein
MNLYLYFVLFAILFLLIIYYYPTKIYGIENFEDYDMITDASNYKIQFPSIEELTEKIASLNYFKFFKETDSKARGINHKYDDFLKKYNSSIMKFEDTDKSNFTSFYNDIIESIPRKHRPLMLSSSDLKIAKVTGIENGFPHTHEDIVVFDKSYFDQLQNYTKDQQNQYNKMSSTLIHEIVHIKQRESETKFDSLYRQWGFQSVSYQYIQKHLSNIIVSRIRINPDELPYYRFWVWNNTVMPLIIYSSSDINNINQTNYIGIDWKTKKHRYLDNFTDYMEYFGIDNNNYHPIEILAEYQAQFYLELRGIDKKKNKSEGYKIYKKHFMI